MKRFVSIFLTIVLALGIAIPASAAGIGNIIAGPIETDAEKVARVQAEVLSGNITNNEDVIEVALDQFMSMCINKGVKPTDYLSENPYAALTVSQTLSSEININGEFVDELASTTLVITNEEGEIASVAEILDYFSRSQSGEVYNGNIAVTTTMYLTQKYAPTDEAYYFYKATRIVNSFVKNPGYIIDGFIPKYVFISWNTPVDLNGTYVPNPTNISYTFYPGDDWRHREPPGDTVMKGGAFVYYPGGHIEVFNKYELWGDNTSDYFFGEVRYYNN